MSGRAALMAANEVRACGRAAELPAAWDDMCTSLLQTRRLLGHYEETNPCRQRYHMLWRAGRPVAGAVVYGIRQNLLTFLGNLPSRVRMNIVGLPASVPPAGVIGSPTAVGELLAAVFAAESGLTVALNLPPAVEVPGANPVRMLPDMILRRQFADPGAYRAALRSPWRRRLDRSAARFAGAVTRRSTCAEFTDRHHRLYLDVLARAAERLETLSCAFFRGLPPPFELVSCYRGADLLCWRIVLAERGRLTFVIGGHDYARNAENDAYFNNLYGVLADGFAAGAQEIDLGQTAEDAKARLGAVAVETRMVLHSSSRLLDAPLRLASPLIAYRGRPRAYRVFRQEESCS